MRYFLSIKLETSHKKKTSDIHYSLFIYMYMFVYACLHLRVLVSPFLCVRCVFESRCLMLNQSTRKIHVTCVKQ